MSEGSQQLAQLQAVILDNLASTGEELAVNTNVRFTSILEIARITGRPEVLQKAFEKARSLTDGVERATAYIDLLREVDMQMRRSSAASSEVPAAMPREAIGAAPETSKSAEPAMEKPNTQAKVPVQPESAASTPTPKAAPAAQAIPVTEQHD